jgi:hypothetical protein
MRYATWQKNMLFTTVHFFMLVIPGKAFSIHIGHLVSPSHSGYDSIIPIGAEHCAKFAFKTDGTHI